MKDMNEKFDKKLREQEKITEERLLQEKLDSEMRLAKTLETHSKQNQKVFSEMIQGHEQKITEIINSQGEQVAEMRDETKHLREDFAKLEEYIKKNLKQRGEVGTGTEGIAGHSINQRRLKDITNKKKVIEESQISTNKQKTRNDTTL